MCECKGKLKPNIDNSLTAAIIARCVIVPVRNHILIYCMEFSMSFDILKRCYAC